MATAYGLIALQWMRAPAGRSVAVQLVLYANEALKNKAPAPGCAQPGTSMLMLQDMALIAVQ
jgi:hypothetical protein